MMVPLYAHTMINFTSNIFYIMDQVDYEAAKIISRITDLVH